MKNLDYFRNGEACVMELNILLNKAKASNTKIEDLAEAISKIKQKYGMGV